RGRSVLLEDLPMEIVAETSKVPGRYAGGATGAGWGSVSPWSAHKDERKAITGALRRSGGHRGRAAKLLGIDRTTLWRKMRRLGITPDPE
ncbi:MAG: helix-turn-helix domain-containing protein, partial [Candidatus Eisenbacteria bacterium]